MENLKFRIPKYLDQDWETQAKQAEGLEHLLLANLSRAKNLIKDIQDYSVTPERLGWMLVWNNTFHLSKSAYDLWKMNSEYLSRVLNRIDSEFILIIYTIFDPITNLFERYKKEGNIIPLKNTQIKQLDKCIDRLNAYLAFTLVKDVDTLNDLLKPRYIDGIFDPKPASEIKQDKGSLKFHEEFFGELDIETEHQKLKKEKEKYLANINQRLEFVEQLSSHPKLKKWITKINNPRTQNRGSINFFELFDASKTSVWQKFKQYDIEFGYLGYKQGSQIIHSSTFEPHFIYFENEISPYALPIGDTLDQNLRFNFSICTRTLIMLRLLQNRLWEEINDMDL